MIGLTKKTGPKHSVIVEHDLEMTTSDGVILRADVYRPSEPGRYPAILFRTPYDKSVRTTTNQHLPAVRAATAGFVFVCQDIRGRLASDGEWAPFSPEVESADGYDTVEWVASLPYCDGNVGTIGNSYESFIQFAAAVSHPPHLKAIAPHGSASAPRGVMTPSAFSISWGASMASAWIQERVEQGEEVDPAHLGVIADALRDPAGSAWHLPLDDHPLNRMGIPGEPFAWSLREDMLHGHLPWEEVEVPALFTAGWFDSCITYGLEQFQTIRSASKSAAARDGARLIIGPWDHGGRLSALGDLYFGIFAQPEPSGLIDSHLAFFGRHLRGDDVPELPLVQYFLLGANEWRQADSWPPAGAVERRFFLHSRGAANGAGGDGVLDLTPPAAGENPDSYAYNPLDPVPAQGVRIMTGGGCPVGPFDQQRVETRPDVLVYTSDAFDAPTEIAGPVSCGFFASSSAVDTDFFAKLCVVDDSGVSRNLVDGLVRTRWRHGGDEPLPLVPGEVVAYEIDLGPIAVRVSTGQRIRLQITSSCFPAYDRNMNTGNETGTDATGIVAQQTVFHTAEFESYLSLFIVAPT